jgi:ketosteroid isomerase-like protein
MGSASAVVERLYRAFANKDLAGVIALLDPEVRWREADGYPYAGIYRGPQAVKAGVFDRIIAEWSSYSTVPSEIVEQGNTVIGLGTYTGTYAGTGKTFSCPFAHVWRVRSGRIIDFDQHTDTYLVQQALK